MNILKLSAQTALKRPVIIILPAVLALVFSVLNSYNPVIPVIRGLSSATGGSLFDGIISALQLVLDPAIIPSIAIFIAAALILGSLLAGLIFSGYFHIIRNTLEGMEKEKGDFAAGIKRYFFRVFLITLRAAFFAGLVLGIMSIATVPAIIISRAAATTKPELMLAAVFVDVLTAVVWFFAYMFSKVYLFYWYPASVKVDKKPFIYAKHLVDEHFWRIVARFIVFDVVFAVFLFLVFILSSALLEMLLGWIFITVFAVVLVIYVFSSFAEIVVSNGQNNRP